MANVKIPELSALASPAPNDLLVVADVSTANDEVKKTSVGEVVGIITGDVEVATDGTATISELPVSKLQDGAARQLLQTAANGIDVEWTDDVNLPGTLDVTGITTLDDVLNVAGLASLDGGIDVDGVFTVADTTGDIATSGALDVGGQSTLASAAVSDLTSGRVVLAGASGEIEDSANLVFDGSELSVTGTLDVSSNGTIGGDLTVVGNLTVEGATTTLETETVVVEDKNIELGVTASPTDATADSGGITLKGSTDKTFNWLNATDAWTSSEHIDLASGKSYYIGGAETLSATALGSAVVSSSLTSVGTIGTGTWEASTIATSYGGTGQTTYADGEVLIGTTAGGLAKATLTPGNGIDITNADGSITIDLNLKANGGLVIESTELAIDLGASSITGTLGVADGGTGQTTYADGQLLIGKTDGGLAKATLSEGTGIDITNADGSITIAIDNTVVTTSDTGSVTSAMLANGTIVNEDINDSAAIAGTKIDPDFGSQFIETTGRVRASSGILFGSDTDPANALDDYEEGTWVPNFIGTSTAGTPTYNTNGQAGKYTKVGNKVTAWAYLDVTALGGAAGNINITGLPFTINNLGFGAAGISVGHADGTLGNGVRAYHGTDLLELRNNNAVVAAATGQIYIFVAYAT